MRDAAMRSSDASTPPRMPSKIPHARRSPPFREPSAARRSCSSARSRFPSANSSKPEVTDRDELAPPHAETAKDDERTRVVLARDVALTFFDVAPREPEKRERFAGCIAGSMRELQRSFERRARECELAERVMERADLLVDGRGGDGVAALPFDVERACEVRASGFEIAELECERAAARRASPVRRASLVSIARSSAVSASRRDSTRRPSAWSDDDRARSARHKSERSRAAPRRSASSSSASSVSSSPPPSASVSIARAVKKTMSLR